MTCEESVTTLHVTDTTDATLDFTHEMKTEAAIGGVLMNRCSKNLFKINSKTSAMESNF